jgi:two-component system copper resistance phosphate regulon response regulator CusR
MLGAEGMKLLLIEDEAKAAGYLRRGFRECGYTVDVASDGETGLDWALAEAPDLVILDVMLPRRDGWSVLAELRRAGRTTPVLVLSARDAVADRVKGLALGADDYLVKPFAFEELLARVRNLLRRAERPPSRGAEAELVVEDLRLDRIRHKALRAGQPLDLTPKEFALLTLLAERTGEVVSRTVIAEAVWDITFECNTNVIDVHVRRLRAKLDDPFPRRLLHTVRGLGYVLEARP